MTPSQIQEKLEIARTKQRKLRKQIDFYRNLLINTGCNPDKPKKDLVPRNKSIYRAWKRGLPFSTIAREANLSTTRIASICKRIENIVQNRLPIPSDYKDLVQFRHD